jgi:hypothetical protein
MKPLDDGSRKIKSSQLVVVWNQMDGCYLVKLVLKTRVVASLVERDAIAFLASEDRGGSTNFGFAFSESEMLLSVMQLMLLVVGDITFFTDALG